MHPLRQITVSVPAIHRLHQARNGLLAERDALLSLINAARVRFVGRTNRHSFPNASHPARVVLDPIHAQTPDTRVT